MRAARSQIGQTGCAFSLSAARCDDSTTRSRWFVCLWPLALHSQKFAEEHVEVVDAVFAFYGVAAAVVSGGVQAALHVFAEQDIFLLDFVAEGDGFFDTLALVLG